MPPSPPAMKALTRLFAVVEGQELSVVFAVRLLICEESGATQHQISNCLHDSTTIFTNVTVLEPKHHVPRVDNIRSRSASSLAS